MSRFVKLIPKIVIVSFAIIHFSIDSFAQLNPRSTLYSFHQSSYNPAVCGAYDYGSADLVIRKQYLGFEGNSGPASTWFDFSMPIKSLNSGAGLSIAQTKEGFEKRLSAKLNYAYHLNIGVGSLGFGLSAGLNNAGWDFSNAIYPDGTSDNFIESTIASQESFSNLLLGFGMFYKRGGLYAAAAVTELNEPALKYETGKTDYLKRHYWLSGGYEYQLSNPKWSLYPSMTLKTTFSDWQASFDCRAIYNNFIIGGICYTSSNDISINIGAQFADGTKLDGLKAIFSYDIVTSKIGGESAGSLEFMVSYDFNIFVEKENKTYKSVRFL
ncbi:MAG: PorP/SprF family type IX secretion system membrane protein [Bacteroidales bacterium]|nr:PorP/SprF family type IX secretion system membrane protein [Bacteroidales bacterium]